MREFLQGVLISLALTTPIFWMSNGFTLSPKATKMPAMDMTGMLEMDHSAMTETSPGKVMPAEMDHSQMDMSGMDHGAM
jgi:uncharacterized protein involved in copper resistance